MFEKIDLKIFFKTIYIYIISMFIGVLFFLPCFICALLPEKYRYNNMFYYWCVATASKLLLKLSFIEINITGQNNIPKEPVIFVANHQSSFDIPLVSAIVGARKYIWIVLEYYSNYPVLGFFVRRMNVSVDRGNSEKAGLSLIKIFRLLKDQQRDLVIFPEAARFTDGKIHRFMPGFAMLSKKLNRPIVPIYMPNNYKIFPPGTFLIYNYPIIAHVGEPLICAPDESEESFTQRVQDWFISKSELN